MRTLLFLLLTLLKNRNFLIKIVKKHSAEN
uniref:Uncharacterized protein n=1 Tax=Siphoviridae sp. ct2D011 TaxID=2825314 RepID=A0A8S5V9J6_9CAUD|nr:MAG TPA: hypothetical protein [Siphoviridae sp. ct2D011]